MGEGQIKFIAFYFAFFLSVSLLGALVPDGTLGISSPIPDPPSAAGLGAIVPGAEILFLLTYFVYFFGLQGLTVVGIPVAIAGAISTFFNVILVYVTVRLIRGGG